MMSTKIIYKLFNKLITSKMKTNVILLFICLLLCVSNMQGQEWLNITPGNYESSQGFFIDNKNGWINARTESYNYSLLYTKNGGESFEEIYAFPEPGIRFYRIQMVDSLIGYGTVYGIDTFFLKTTNGGYNWVDKTDTSIMDTDFLNVHYFVNPDTGFYCGPNSIYKTINGGELWTKMITPDPGDTLDDYEIIELYFHNAQYGWAACSCFEAGFGMKTIDGGENWELCIPTYLSEMRDVHFFDSLNGGIVGQSWGSVAALTEDNFNSLSYLHYFPHGINTIVYQNDSIIWVCGSAILWRSTDKGLSFTVFQDIQIPGIVNPYIYDMQFFENTGYTFGDGFLLKFEDTLINNISSKEANKDGINVWPNPTNDIINIQIKSSEPEEVTLTLFSIEGKLERRIKSLLNPGINRITFNIENIDPGVYFLTIEGKRVFKHQKIIKQ